MKSKDCENRRLDILIDWNLESGYLPASMSWESFCFMNNSIWAHILEVILSWTIFEIKNEYSRYRPSCYICIVVCFISMAIRFHIGSYIKIEKWAVPPPPFKFWELTDIHGRCDMCYSFIFCIRLWIYCLYGRILYRIQTQTS
jgi:hypothetical protein